MNDREKKLTEQSEQFKLENWEAEANLLQSKIALEEREKEMTDMQQKLNELNVDLQRQTEGLK